MTPLQEIENHPGRHLGIRLWLKRDELIHPQIAGNKWRKLRLLLENQRFEGILTFGGPFSNHLHAVASAGKFFGFPTVGIVRGEASDFNNPTLFHARECGMTLFKVKKKVYDLKLAAPEVAEIVARFPGLLMLPEGGATAEGVLGCTNISREILRQLAEAKAADLPLTICVPAGTGSTAAGASAGLGALGRVLVFPAAHGVSGETIGRYLTGAGLPDLQNFEVIENRYFKKFADLPPDLLAFVQNFKSETGILLDPIYTSKMMFSLWEMLAAGQFSEKSAIVALHTGGLQGWAGFKDWQNLPESANNSGTVLA